MKRQHSARVFSCSTWKCCFNITKIWLPTFNEIFYEMILPVMAADRRGKIVVKWDFDVWARASDSLWLETLAVWAGASDSLGLGPLAVWAGASGSLG